jgi:hypothetical protein
MEFESTGTVLTGNGTGIERDILRGPTTITKERGERMQGYKESDSKDSDDVRGLHLAAARF